MSSIEVKNGALLRCAGPASAPLLMFFPAFGDSGLCYEGVFSSELSTQYRLIAVDLWGFGASPARSEIRSFTEFSAALEELVSEFWSGEPIGLIGHSIAGSMVTQIAHSLEKKISEIFSIEGNLTPDDAMFTGRASSFHDPANFKQSFLEEIWKLGQDDEALRHYYAGARMSDPETMWQLGCDVKLISENNNLGEAFRKLSQPSLYYWSKRSTPQETQAWIVQSKINNEVYSSAGHWPMVEQPTSTALRIRQFFDAIQTN